MKHESNQSFPIFVTFPKEETRTIVGLMNSSGSNEKAACIPIGSSSQVNYLLGNTQLNSYIYDFAFNIPTGNDKIKHLALEVASENSTLLLLADHFDSPLDLFNSRFLFLSTLLQSLESSFQQDYKLMAEVIRINKEDKASPPVLL